MIFSYVNISELTQYLFLSSCNKICSICSLILKLTALFMVTLQGV